VFDCWFESGSMPYAQNHYPFDAQKVAYVEKNLPADFIAEGLDQTRGWFYTLHVLSTALFNRPAFKNVIVSGLILAADGKKMSKRLKNYPDPSLVIDAFGADALRAYLTSSVLVRGEPMRFGKNAADTTGECVKETLRLVILPLWNAYNFFATYAVADGWSPTEADLRLAPTGDLDRWIDSRLQQFLLELKAQYEQYELSNLVPAFTRLCDDLNNWYVRRGRRRYWSKAGESTSGDADKQQAYATLFRVLVTAAHAMAPVLPFFCEYLFQRLMVDSGLATPGDSVHLRAFPEADPSRVDPALELRMQAAREVVSLGLVLREREKLGVRRPLARVTVAHPDPVVRAALTQLREAITAELNVKDVAVLADDSALCSVVVKPNLRTLGKRLGSKLKAVGSALGKLTTAALQQLEATGELEVEGERLSKEDVLLSREAKAGGAIESHGGFTVLLDTQLTPELQAEGLARELISRIQGLRKDAGLEVSQRIHLSLACAGALQQVVLNPALSEIIARETLASSLQHVPEVRHPHVKSDLIDQQQVTIGLERAM
jgi:isoleucyl-tRNA synthetase